MRGNEKGKMIDSTFKIGSKIIGKEDIFFVIEEGQANLGDYNKALSMIDIAAETGADAIEFQLARAADFYVKNHQHFETYLKREFSDSQIKDLVTYTKSKGLEFIAVPLTSRLIAPLADAGCSGFNINASDLTNPDIVDAVVDSGIPFLLSLPLATEEEINWAVERIALKKRSNFACLHGQHTMAGGDKGVDLEYTSLGYINTIKNRYQVPAGFIDHTPYKWMPAAAVCAGADVISKHLVLSSDEKGPPWPDWQVCLEPEEMKEAIALARKARKSIKTTDKILVPGEKMDRSVMRRSIVASKTITAGDPIKREDIVFKRPGTGIDPSRYIEIINRVVLRDIQEDEQIMFSDLKEK
jgi:sialic acid synthase SpsE